MSLGTILNSLACKARVTLNELTVLSASNDPFRIGNPTTHRNSEWLRDRMQQLGLLDRESGIHNRGLHYALVAKGNVRRPDRSPYINDADCWDWLERTSKAARWLGYIGFDKIVDARNTEPVIRPRQDEFCPKCEVGFEDSYLPTDFVPEVETSGFNAIQNYRLVFWGEKTSLGEVLGPLAQEFNADLYLPSGETSDSQLYTMARTGVSDSREMVVLVFSDCDPAGYQMAVSISHKLRAFKEGFYPDLKFQVHAPALSVGQVRQLGLPSTPLKETEMRADGWRARYGVEQTEIDALATLRPDLLEVIVREAAAPFYDGTLEDRVQDAASDWQDEAADQLDQALDANDEFLALRKQAREGLKAARAASRRMRQIVDAIEFDLSPPPEVQPETGETPAPLVSSEVPLLVAIGILRARKDYSERVRPWA